MINKIIWLSLSAITRDKIAKDFGMKKTEGCEVIGSRVVSDGYSNESLMMITQKGLEERVGRTQNSVPKDFMKLWEYYVSDINEEEVKYSNDEGLNDTLNKSLGFRQARKEDAIDYDKQIADRLNNGFTAGEDIRRDIEPKFKITRTQKEAQEIAETLKKKSEPKKKMGRPKGSKKVGKKTKK